MGAVHKSLRCPREPYPHASTRSFDTHTQDCRPTKHPHRSDDYPPGLRLNPPARTAMTAARWFAEGSSHTDSPVASQM
eukprot:780845-Rhodomonas_salina.1